MSISPFIITRQTAIEHISESVFVGLCRKVGTSQLVAMRRDMMDISEMMKNHVSKGDNISMMLSGSQREGFRLKGSDKDIMFWPNDHRVVWDLSQYQYCNTQNQTLILCDCSESPPGFALLYLPSPSKEPRIQRACIKMKNRHYISSSIYRQIMCSAAPLTCSSIQHGPCESGIYITIEYDIADCFVCDFWPPSASSWIHRCHTWPQSDVVDDLVQNGCHFVAVGHKLGSHEDSEWRISFSLAEQKLVCAMNHCQFLTFALLKLFLTEIINNGLRDDDKLLCSYHMKTVVFWVIQLNTIPHWCPQNLLGCFWVCFKRILKWVYEGICPNFFIPGNNMFLGKIYSEAQHQLFVRLYGLYEKGFAYLLQSPSIRIYIINALHIPRLSICTDEHNLISEAEFDVNLFQEIYRQDTLPSLNLQGCMRYLSIIEQTIGSPLLTQFQVLMLQKLTANDLQKIAFNLHTKTYTHENKLRYRADKICHMLKLAAKFGFLPDMLYIVMYYFETLKYIEALSIIKMIKVKLAKPFVMFYNVNIKMYSEATCGQSWPTKMRQAVAWHIKLDNKIHYISELIPEQQSALQNGQPEIFLPPMVLLYMLEILCYRHVDTMRSRIALDDLQTLVHYDKGQFIHVLYRDISWQILGICQQVTGNFQAALYSYQKSLTQEPYHKIQTATEMRIAEIFRCNPCIT
ncbi:uncharacterized protein LOC133187055 [Saccostrea echinata]|uniref:uncharacterized protein LOC133187055 n=1 Tax=Saccostrea echinata TaxID=191078 RepID=UPI002A80A2E9|nr:uncharacterized protein LOC133187055 [Saccostrea echinata]